jgi:DNA-binding NarL/FixJ family response regulator
MKLRIAVSDPLPLFQRGVMVTLRDAGFDLEAPDDLLGWARHEPQRVVLLTVDSADDWGLLAELHKASPGLISIAILPDASTSTYVRAMLTGAAAAVPRDAPPDTLKQVFEAAIAGKSLLPVEVVRVLAFPRNAGEEQSEAPSAREIEWLRMLARGVTVAQLASHAGYSERAMFRMLRDLYRRMQVGSRTEALMQARDNGWL